MSCIICWAETEGRCPLCGLAICERDLRLHTNPEVESHCFPWRVESLPHCGRVLTATRDIAPFELLISDTALVLAPNDLPVCLGCLDELPPGSVTACAGCQWPLCCAGCQDSPQHRQECLLLSQAGVVPALDSEHSNQWIYTAVALLRVLLLKRDQPDQWEKVEQLMDHWEERATNTEVVKAMKIMFAFFSNKLDNKHGLTFSCSGCQQARDFTEKFERFQQIEGRLSSCSLSREELRSFLAEIDADEQIHDQFYLKVRANMKYCEMFQDSSDRETLEEVMSRVKTVLNLIRDIDQGCSKVTGKYVLVLAEVQEKLLTLRRKEDPAVQPSQLRKEVADLIKSKMIANKMLGQHYTTPKHKPATTSSKEGT